MSYKKLVPIIYLKDTDTNDIGDHIIPYNPRTIKNITLNGEITCTDTSAEWYCAGGGIYFELTDELGNSKLIHKEYKFNQGNILRITLILSVMSSRLLLYNKSVTG